ncbi:MAG: aminopeptidase P family protein [Candidatus Zixiibacteriota bacterium]|nr:MAG: aminopeptidase P family protein [candidate division Zixibacteria bacterium]
MDIKTAAFEHIAHALKDGRPLTEYDVCRFILDAFEKSAMVTEHFPNCSVNAHAGDPHYEPQPEGSSAIKKGDLILIDLWAKIDTPYGLFADITWMAYAGTAGDIPARYHEIFALVTAARDKAVDFLRQHIDSRPVSGYEVDDVCREVIVKGGYGEFFTHRTGHSIGSSVHFVGPNIDNLETEDHRKLKKGHLFSIEPGIYLDDCGFRSEIDVLIGHDGIEVTTLPLQQTIQPLL